MKVYKKDKNMILLRTLTAILILLSLFSPAPATEMPQILTLKEFIDSCIRNNPDIFYELEKIKSSDAEILKSQGTYDTVFTAYYKRLYDQPFNDYSAVRIESQKTDVFGFGFQRKIPATGTRLKAEFEYSRNKMEILMQDMSVSETEYFNPYHVIELQQPLLKNWLGILDKFPLKQSRLNSLITRITVDESIETIISDLYNIYFTWYLEYGKLLGYERSVTDSMDLMRKTEMRYKAGLSTYMDFLQTEKQYLTFIKTRDNSRISLSNLNRMISTWYTGKNGLTINLIPEHKPSAGNADLTVQLMSNSRQMEILKLTKDLLAAQMKMEDNKSMPELNLILSAKKAAYIDNEKFNFGDFDYNQYSVGLSLSYPIGSNESKGEKMEIGTRLEQWKYDVEKFERDFILSFNELVKLRGIAAEHLEYDRRLLRNASDSLKEREKRYRLGRDDLFYVIEDRYAATNMEITELEDYTQLQVLTVRLLALADRLKDR